MKKVLLTAVAVCLMVSGVMAQSALQQQRYRAFVANSVKQWKAVATASAKQVKENDKASLLEAIESYYGYTSLLIENKQKTDAKKAIEEAEVYVDKLLKLDANNPEGLNYKGAFLSFQITLNKLSGIKLGKESMAYIDKAYKLSPTNVQVLLDKGNALYFPPELFGGDKAKALGFYQKAIAQIERTNSTKNNWRYLRLLYLEGKCHEAMGNNTKANQSYQKALKVEPNFSLLKK